MKIIRLVLLSTLLVGTMAQAEGTSDSWNVRTSPLGLMLGLGNLRLDYKVADQWVVGPRIIYWDLRVGDLKVNAIGAGVSAAYYFNPVFQHSWYVEGGVHYADLNVESRISSDNAQKTKVTNFGIQALGGYHWFWGHFNLNVGGGLNINTTSKYEVKNASGAVIREQRIPAVTPALDASIGWTF